MSEENIVTYVKELSDTLKDYLNKTETEILEKKYIGKVVNNNDPDKNQRCKIRVYGIYDDKIPDGDLPWALREDTFVGSLVGSCIIPPIDALVYVRFEDGDIYKPVYSTKALKTGKTPSDQNSNYPDNVVFFELDGGDKFYINRSTGETIYEQRAGVKITMQSNGAFKLETTAGTNIDISNTGAFELQHSKGTIFEVDILGNVNMKSGNTNPLSSITIQSGAAGRIQIQGGTMPCPDAPSCLITGGPLATGTLIPGKQVLIP